MYDVDLYNTHQSTIDSLHAAGHKVCRELADLHFSEIIVGCVLLLSWNL